MQQSKDWLSLMPVSVSYKTGENRCEESWSFNFDAQWISVGWYLWLMAVLSKKPYMARCHGSHCNSSYVRGLGRRTVARSRAGQKAGDPT
jgi:hypothetical protein